MDAQTTRERLRGQARRCRQGRAIGGPPGGPIGGVIGARARLAGDLHAGASRLMDRYA